MGLDMYLTASKFVGGGYGHYRNDYIHEEGKPTRVVPKASADLPEEAKLFDRIIRTLGFGTFKSFSKAFPNGNSLTVSINVAYWRKANAIHKWFVDNVQGGRDECQESYVTRVQLQALLDLVTTVLTTVDKGEPVTEKGWDGQDFQTYPNAKVDVERAKNLLPSQEGFFFGSYDYDQWYIADLESTRDQLTSILKSKKLEGYDFYYQSSW